MESQQAVTINNIVRQIEIREYRLLEVDSINDILTFASAYPGQEHEAVDILLDILHFHADPGSIDKDSVYLAIRSLHDAADAIDNLESVNIIEMPSIQNQNTSNVNRGDYFVGSESDFVQLIERLDEHGTTNHYATPPASKRAIEALPNIKIKEEDSSYLQCVVCMEDMTFEVKHMPCKHIFHADCIIPWLELRNSCPLCRYQLPDTYDDNLDYDRDSSYLFTPNPSQVNSTDEPNY